MPRTFTRLYELNAPWAENLIDLDTEQAEYNPFDDLDAREESDNEKLAECCRVVRNLEVFGEAAKSEAKRLADKVKLASDRVDRIKAYMKAKMERIGDTKRQVDDLFCVAIQKSPPSVAVTNLDLVPASYDKPVVREVSLSAIKADLLANKWVPGVELVHGSHVRIK